MADKTPQTASQIPQTIGAWVVVSVPLLYGLIETLQNVVKLFNPPAP